MPRSEALERIEQANAVFGAMAHPSRRQILLIMKFRGGEMTAGEIAGRFSCRWPTTTRHLQVLVEAGLVTAERRGRERIYRLESAKLLSVAKEWLQWFEEAPAPKAAGARRDRTRRRRGRG